jgi:circadian clock protein KaiB
MVKRLSAKKKKFTFKLFVTGATSRSAKAITNLTVLCESHLKGQYELEVVDLYKQPERARNEQILAAPTLVKTSPLPLRRFIGDLSNTEHLMAGLELAS